MRNSRLPSARLVYPTALAAVVIVIVWVIITWITQVNPVDFLVYRYGADAVLNRADLYAGNLFGPMMPVGGMPFTYTPFAAILLAPTVLFDSHTAYLLWSVLSVAVVAWASHRFTPSTVRRRTLVVVGLTLLLSATTMVTQHISFGQINLPLMALVLVDVLRPDSGRFARVVPCGVLVGIAAAIKLTPALFILYFVITRQWKAALWSAIGGTAATLLAFVLAPRLSVEFWSEVLWTLNKRVDFGGGGFASSGNNSLQGIVAAMAPDFQAVALPLVALAGAFALFLAARTYRQGRPVDAALIVGLTAPLLSPISWIHHWVYLLPAALTLIFHSSRRLRVIGFVMLVLLIPGPGLGDLMISASPLLAPLGWVMRESLAVASILCIVLLSHAVRRPSQFSAPTRDVRLPTVESRLR